MEQSRVVQRSSQSQRIVLAIESSGPGGAENVVLRLAEELRRTGDHPIVATLRPGWLTRRAEEAGFPVWVDPQRHGVDLSWVVRFAQRLRRERIDILHAHEPTMSLFGGTAAIVARVHALSTLHGRHHISARRLRVLAYRALRAFGVEIVAVSQDLADFLAQELGLPASALRVVNNGIPLSSPPALSGRAARTAAARAALSLPLDGPLLVAVGNLYPVKDHATLLRAAAFVPEAHVAIAGRGDEEENLRRLADELGISERIHLLGLQENVELVLEAGDVFVQPSLSEGLPLAILEAMAACLPVVATAVGGVGEAVLESETGFLVPPGDPERLADGLRRVLESGDGGRALAAAGRSRVEAEFSVIEMARRYRKFYRRGRGQVAGDPAP